MGSFICCVCYSTLVLIGNVFSKTGNKRFNSWSSQRLIKYKSIIFGSIGTLVETSNIQRKSFNKAFKKLGLDWHWSVSEYKTLLEKSGGENRLSKYANEKNIKINTKKLRDLKTKFFNNYLKKNTLKPRAGVLNIINFCKKNHIKLGFATSTSVNNINSIFLL